MLFRSGGNGKAYTGGGGGGGPSSAGSGGSGVVIFSIPTVNYTGLVSSNTTVVTCGTNTILLFKTSGNYTA